MEKVYTVKITSQVEEQMKQYDMGYGDYTKEKQEQPDMSLEEIDLMLKNVDNH